MNLKLKRFFISSNICVIISQELSVILSLFCPELSTQTILCKVTIKSLCTTATVTFKIHILLTCYRNCLKLPSHACKCACMFSVTGTNSVQGFLSVELIYSSLRTLWMFVLMSQTENQVYFGGELSGQTSLELNLSPQIPCSNVMEKCSMWFCPHLTI